MTGCKYHNYDTVLFFPDKLELKMDSKLSNTYHQIHLVQGQPNLTALALEERPADFSYLAKSSLLFHRYLFHYFSVQSRKERRK